MTFADRFVFAIKLAFWFIVTDLCALVTTPRLQVLGSLLITPIAAPLFVVFMTRSEIYTRTVQISMLQSSRNGEMNFPPFVARRLARLFAASFESA